MGHGYSLVIYNFNCKFLYTLVELSSILFNNEGFNSKSIEFSL